jgi:peptidoglycan/xylan/chitin deacetylase (PgdA/CDA1 family)
MTCLMENWSEGKGPPFSVQTTSLRPGTHDRAAMTWGTYGGHAGVWRLLKILEANKVPATFIANARALELNPAAAKQIIALVHEIAGHS